MILHRIMEKNNDLEKIELRSEKVRRIVNEKPPFFIRYGTIILTILLLLAAIIVCLDFYE